MIQALGIIQENETIIDRSYNEVVIPEVQAESRLVTITKGKGNRLRVQEFPVPILLKNKRTLSV